MEVFKSNLSSEPLVYYDKEFESEEINEEDVNKDVYLYKISIFGNMYHIAMGNKKNHENNESVIYYVVYLVYNKKVVTKIGIYEYLKQQIENGEPDFSTSNLLINPKYYKQPFILHSFKLNEVEVENAVNEISDEKYLILKDGSLDLVIEPNVDELYELLKTKLKASPKEAKENLKNLLSKDYKLFINNCVVPNIKDGSYKETIKTKLDQIKSGVIGKIEVEKDKFKYGYFFEKRYEKFKSGQKYSYKINDLLLLFIEINLNVKFLILNENMMLNSFNLIQDYRFGDYLEILSNLKEYKKEDQKIIDRKNYILNAILNYNPIDVIFLQKISEDKYLLLKNLDKNISNIQEFDFQFLNHLRTLYEKEDHLYKYDTQLLFMKERFDALYKSGFIKDNGEEKQELEEGSEQEDEVIEVEEEHQGAEETEEGQGAENLPKPPMNEESKIKLPEPPKVRTVTKEQIRKLKEEKKLKNQQKLKEQNE